MFKQMIHLEANGAEGRKYSLICPPGSPKGEVYDCLRSMEKYVLELMQEVHLKQKPEEKEEQSEPQEVHE